MKRLCQFSFVLFFCIAAVQNSISQVPDFTVQTPVFRKDTFNILQYGAVADGITDNTDAIQRAILVCNAKKGGVVLVPPGFWLSGPIVLKSNVELHLQKNALLLFTGDHQKFKLVKGNWEGLPAFRNQSPISAENEVNIAITGKGIIDGNGDTWRSIKKDKLTETQWNRLVKSGGKVSEDKKTWYPSESYYLGSKTDHPGVIKDGRNIEDAAPIKEYLRPNMLVFTSCRFILIEGVTFQNSPAWTLHPLLCENLTIRNITVKNPWNGQNTDGLDIESCKSILLENSSFDVGDDGICVKSGRDEAGRKRGIPTENLIIRNCVVYHAHGGFVVGSEMSGGAKNLYLSNCSFIGTDVGLRFKTTRGRGGVVEKVYIDHVNMKDIVGEAILFDMYYMAKDPVPLTGEKREDPAAVLQPVTEETPVFRDFHISDVFCAGADKAIFIRGLPEMKIKQIYLNNLILQTDQGIVCEDADSIYFKNVFLAAAHNNPLINCKNSSHIHFDGISFKEATLLLLADGAVSKSISIKIKGDQVPVKVVQTVNGADAQCVQVLP